MVLTCLSPGVFWLGGGRDVSCRGTSEFGEETKQTPGGSFLIHQALDMSAPGDSMTSCQAAWQLDERVPPPVQLGE